MFLCIDMFLNRRKKGEGFVAKDDINAFLGAGTVFNGFLNFQGAVRIDGCYSGEIQSDGTLVAGKDSKIDGKISVGEFNLAGNFTGDVYATRRVIIYKGGVLKGSVYSPNLIVEEGAILDGNIIMGEHLSARNEE